MQGLVGGSDEFVEVVRRVTGLNQSSGEQNEEVSVEISPALLKAGKDNLEQEVLLISTQRAFAV
jgi:hypothetical protein